MKATTCFLIIFHLVDTDSKENGVLCFFGTFILEHVSEIMAVTIY